MSETYVMVFAYFSIGLGIVNLFMREITPQKYRKLGMMKKALGPRAGHGLHILAYSVVPLMVGGMLLYGLHQSSS